MAEPPGPTTPPEPTRPIPGGPQPTAPGAVATLVYGILALFICGPLFGTIAIVKANKVKRFIAENPQYGGEGYATAGLVLGIVALVLFALVVLFQLASGA
jgi:ABC-type phosphate transport system permease subunit